MLLIDYAFLVGLARVYIAWVFGQIEEIELAVLLIALLNESGLLLLPFALCESVEIAAPAPATALTVNRAHPFPLDRGHAELVSRRFYQSHLLLIIGGQVRYFNG